MVPAIKDLIPCLIINFLKGLHDVKYPTLTWFIRQMGTLLTWTGEKGVGTGE